MNARFNREKARFHLHDRNIFVVQGWIEGASSGPVFSAELDGKPLPLEVRTQSGVEVTRKYLRYKTNVTEEYFLWITLPGAYEKAAGLRVFYGEGKNRQLIFRGSGRHLKKLERHLDSWMEQLSRLPDGRYRLRGWYMQQDGEVRAAILDSAGKPLAAECALSQRSDILGEYPEAVLSDTRGFEIDFAPPSENILRLALKSPGRSALYIVNCRKMLSGKEGLINTARKSWLYLKRKGTRQFVRRVQDEILGIDTISYDRWRRKYGTRPADLAGQKKEYEGGKDLPVLFSVVVPLYRTPEKYLNEMIESMRAQTYPGWELILSDGSGEDSPLKGVLEKWAAKEPRVRILLHGKRLQISENTNEALKNASGDWIIFGDHDDLFAPDALYECVSCLKEHPDAELIYTDEDKTDEGGKRFFEPHFKSDYNPELLCSMNYFCHMVAVKRSLREKTGFLDPAFNGAQDYDFVLRACELTEPGRIRHIPKILYHWRAHQASTAENPESKRYAFESGKRAVQAHYDRLKIAAEVQEGLYPGLYQTRFEICGEPLVSILIPNKDHTEDLEKCLASVMRSDYTNFEILILENNSTQKETFETYARLERENPKVRVLNYGSGGFDFSGVNNFGAAAAKGDYLLLLNNDTEMMEPDCLRQMLGYCQQEGIGAVGALLFYEDGTIQHAGVVLGFGGIAGHAFIGESGSSNGYFSRIICAQDYSAVTAACMMVKADAYRRVGGLSEDLKVAFNDIDFCMKLGSIGLRVVYNPQARLYHYESKSRGLENTAEKIERFNRETAVFLSRWGKQVEEGDPYYNPNLTLDKADFSLKL